MKVTEVERKESTKHCCGNGCLWRDSAEHEEETVPSEAQILAPSQTTFYEGDPKEITGLHTEALGVLFPVDSMDSCEEMMIQDWPGALYKKDDTAFLCWTYSPEVTYVLEYTPSKIDDSEIIKMAESAEPVQ